MIEQRGELDRRQLHHPVHDRRPAERSLLQLLVTQLGMQALRLPRSSLLL